MLARRAQFHRSVLVEYANPLSIGYRNTLGNLSAYFAKSGFSAADASTHAYAQLSHLLDRQASFLAALDCFWLLGCVCLFAAPLIFFSKKLIAAKGAGGGH